jgi:hypothetical protein
LHYRVSALSVPVIRQSEGYLSAQPLNIDFSQLGPLAALDALEAGINAITPVVAIVQGKSSGVQFTSVAGTGISLTAAPSVMYALSLYLESDGSGASGHTISFTFSWTSPVEARSQSVTLPLDTASVVVETFPLLCAANTAITGVFSYGGGATDDPFTYSLRIVQMP